MYILQISSQLSVAAKYLVGILPVLEVSLSCPEKFWPFQWRVNIPERRGCGLHPTLHTPRGPQARTRRCLETLGVSGAIEEDKKRDSEMFAVLLLPYQWMVKNFKFWTGLYGFKIFNLFFKLQVYKSRNLPRHRVQLAMLLMYSDVYFVCFPVFSLPREYKIQY